MTSSNTGEYSRFSMPIGAGIALSAAGAIFYNVLPLLLGSAQDSLELGNQQAGLIGSIYFLGYNVATISAFFWLDKVSWRAVSLLMIPIAAFGMVMIGQLSEYGVVLGFTALIGAAYALLYGIGTSIIADAPQPTKWFGLKIAIEALTGAVLLIGLPLLILPAYGFSGMSLALGIVTLGFLSCLFWVPVRSIRLDKQAKEASPPVDSRLVWVGLVALSLFFAGQTEAWSFVERIGKNSGHDADIIGSVLAVALIFAVVGSLIEAAFAARMGFMKMCVIVASLFFAGALCLGISHSLVTYTIGAWVITLSFGMGLPLLVALASQLDPDGKHTILTVPAIGIGAMIGPWLAGFMTDVGGYSAILLSALLLIVISSILTILAARGSHDIPLADVSI